MRIVFAAGEALPYIKSGGLADVIGSLPKELVKKGHECYVILPKYQDIKFPETLEYVTNFYLWVGWRRCYCGVFKAVYEGVTYFFVDNEQYFRRPGLYGYDDDYERFAFYDFAVLECLYFCVLLLLLKWLDCCLNHMLPSLQSLLQQRLLYLPKW